MASFVDKLDRAAAANNSLVCVGLDPDPALMPIKDVAAFNRAIIEATADLVCAYKPNIAFYEAQGFDGLRALEATLKAVPSNIPVIGDTKRGDIGNTARFYAKAMFDVWGFDAVTVNPFLGNDSLEPFIEYRDRGILVLCRTSNPGARDLQELTVQSDGGTELLYERLAAQVQKLNVHGNLGLVVGATAPKELLRIRQICPTAPILIPGVGAQAGELEASVRNGGDARGRRAMINSSRGIIFASKGADYAQAARKAAQDLRAKINAELAASGKGW